MCSIAISLAEGYFTLQFEFQPPPPPPLARDSAPESAAGAAGSLARRIVVGVVERAGTSAVPLLTKGSSACAEIEASRASRALRCLMGDINSIPIVDLLELENGILTAPGSGIATGVLGRGLLRGRGADTPGALVGINSVAGTFFSAVATGSADTCGEGVFFSTFGLGTGFLSTVGVEMALFSATGVVEGFFCATFVSFGAAATGATVRAGGAGVARTSTEGVALEAGLATKEGGFTSCASEGRGDRPLLNEIGGAAVLCLVSTESYEV
jgi:hypothetical protein